VKAGVLGFGLGFGLFLALFLYLHAVGKAPRHLATVPDEVYADWERRTREQAVAPTAEQVDAWTAKVREAFTPFEPGRAAERFPLAYADTFYFRDAFHLYTEIEPMTAYMVKTAEASPGVTFTFHPPVVGGIDVFLPWVMVLRDKESLGVSHLRFNAEGKVVFHQDYWDSADVLVPKVPVANGIIELVRRRF